MRHGLGGYILRGQDSSGDCEEQFQRGRIRQDARRAFLPFCDEFYPNDCVFQLDNAPAHTTLHTKEFFMMKSVTDMDWPPNLRT